MAANNANASVTSTTPSSRANASVRSRAIGRIPGTLEALNSLQTDERRAALAEALRNFEEGLIIRPQENGWANVLARSFFSYSADEFSPSRLVWEAVIRGLSLIGSADRDNLGALGEMQAAGDALSIRVTVSLETKTYVQSYAERDINCPGQPGFLRALGVGFTKVPSLESDHGKLIASLPNRARERNLAMIEKINAVLAPVSLDYEADVLPLTPAGNATEGHIFKAYALKAKTIFIDLDDQAVFWADVLGRSPNDAESLIGDAAAFAEAVADKLSRIGESGQAPQSAACPPVTGFFQAVRASGAIPCLLWRNGESAGESAPGKLLDDAVNWGARAVALTPDRCWNVPDAALKEKRQAALAELAAAAKERNLPLLPGSFMNEPRQKFVDSFDAPEMAAYFRDFTDAAFWLYGHAVLQRAASLGLSSEWADKNFAADRAGANAFYLEVGKKAAPGNATRARLVGLPSNPAPGEILDALAPLTL